MGVFIEDSDGDFAVLPSLLQTHPLSYVILLVLALLAVM